MKHMILIVLLILSMLPLGAGAEQKTTSQYVEELILAQVDSAFPGWTVSESTVYGSGSYKGKIAMHVQILLFQITDQQFRLKRVYVAADPVLEGEPINWDESEDCVPVPVTDEATQRIAALPPDQVTADHVWLTPQALPGSAAFMLKDGEIWEELGAFKNDLVGVARGQDGRKGLRIAHWNGTAYDAVTASPMWENVGYLNTIHSGYDSLELGVDYGLYYVDLYSDGIWRFAGVNNGYGIYVFMDDYMLDMTNGVGDSSNDLWHYGSASFPRELSQLDIDQIPMRGADLIRLLDASAWACVRESNTPMYAEPEGELLGYAYSRLAGTIVRETGDWVCLQIGSAERGMQAWFQRGQLAFGRETENVRCGFPDYHYDLKKNNLASILNRHLDPHDIQYSEDIFDAIYPGTVWLIARLPDSGFLAEVNEDAVGTLPVGAFDAILPTAEHYSSYDLELNDEEWARLWSDDDNEDEADTEDWYEEKWNSDEFWGSFTSELTFSFDRKYYAAQNWEPSTRNHTGMVTVTICETMTGKELTSFTPARTFDFWGVCWEKDSYNLWTQSADTGTVGYKYHDGSWTRSDTLKRPVYIISRWDSEYRDHPELWESIYRGMEE